MEPVKEAAPCYDQMAIVEKYEKVIAYLYPIAQSIPRKHGVAREMFLQRLLAIPGLLYAAGKSTQVSKLYIVDANLVGGIVDRFVHFELGHRHWARYMDDIVILGDDLARLRDDFAQIEGFSRERLGLRISHWAAQPVSRGVNFLGYRVWATHKLLRKDSVTRAKRKIRRLTTAGDDESLQKFIASWSGHAHWADTHNLQTWLAQAYDCSVLERA